MTADTSSLLEPYVSTGGLEGSGQRAGRGQYGVGGETESWSACSLSPADSGPRSPACSARRLGATRSQSRPTDPPGPCHPLCSTTATVSAFRPQCLHPRNGRIGLAGPSVAKPCVRARGWGAPACTPALIPLLPLSVQVVTQGLSVPFRRGFCKEHPGAFPSEDALRSLSQAGFLRTVHATLGHLLHNLTALQLQFSDAQDLPELPMARKNTHGVRNNIHCLSRQLHISLDMQAGLGTSLPPVTFTGTAPSIFEAKLEGCKLLSGYHRFMGSMGRVLREWGDSPRRSRRDSPQMALCKGTHGTGASRRAKRLVPRGWLAR